jgi:hypothetical protein
MNWDDTSRRTPATPSPSASSGTRTVISSVIVAKGASNGVGRIVETDSLATDPPGSSRDDLVFPGGTIHIISTIVDFSFTINPNCLGRATIRQSGEIQRGTGQFAHAVGTFNGTVRPGAATMAQPEASEVVRYATTVWVCA